MPHSRKWDLLKSVQTTVSMCSSEMMFTLFCLFLLMISPWHASLLCPNHRIYLSQRQYIIDMLEKYGLTNANPVSTPMDPGFKLSTSMAPQNKDDIIFMKSIPYINAVGSLMYLAITSYPDIAYSVRVLARFNSNPGPLHWKVVKHLLRYCKGTMDLKLVYGPSDSSQLFTSYSDADHGGNPDNGHSTGGYLVKIGSGAVSWSSKLQSLVAL